MEQMTYMTQKRKAQKQFKQEMTYSYIIFCLLVTFFIVLTNKSLI